MENETFDYVTPDSMRMFRCDDEKEIKELQAWVKYLQERASGRVFDEDQTIRLILVELIHTTNEVIERLINEYNKRYGKRSA